MKKVLLLLPLCIFCLSVMHAQQVIEGVNTRGFSGVHILPGPYVYTSWFDEKSETKGMARFMMAIFDKDLKELVRQPIEISKNAELSASGGNGQSFLLIFSDQLKKKRTLMTLDNEGQIIKRQDDEGLSMSVLSADNKPLILALPQNEYLVIRAEKEKKIGYEILRINHELQIRYTQSFAPEKGQWIVEDCKIQDQTLYILRRERASAFSDKQVFSIQALDVQTGTERYLTALADQEDGGYADFMAVNDKQEVTTGGVYFHDGKYDEKNSDGLFFTRLDPKGTITSFQKTPWKQVKDQIKGDFSSDLIGGRTKVLIEALIPMPDGTYSLLGETWRKSNNASNTGMGSLMGGLGSGSSSKPGERGFTVMDFVRFRFSKEGQLTQIDRIEKTTKEAVVSGDLGSQPGLAMAQALQKRGFFCYRDVISVDNKPMILFKNDDGVKTRAYFMPVDAMSTQSLHSCDLDKWMPENPNKAASLMKAMGGMKYTFGDEGFNYVNPELYKGILPAWENHMLLYHFFIGKLSIWLEAIPM